MGLELYSGSATFLPSAISTVPLLPSLNCSNTANTELKGHVLTGAESLLLTFLRKVVHLILCLQGFAASLNVSKAIHSLMHSYSLIPSQRVYQGIHSAFAFSFSISYCFSPHNLLEWSSPLGLNFDIRQTFYLNAPSFQNCSFATKVLKGIQALKFKADQFTLESF